MKKVLALVGCIFILFTSCKKDKTQASVYYITADIDGVSKTFNVNNVAGVNNKGNPNLIAPYTIYIYGATTRDNSSDAFSINVAMRQAIAAGATYRGSSDDYANVSEEYLSGAFSTQNSAYVSDPSDGGVAVTVTSLTDNSIQGTFRGTLTKNGDTRTITNGKFNLSFNN